MWFNSFSQAASAPESEIRENGRPVRDKGRGYIFTEALVAAIDVAIGLGRPLLVSGEPGCGKTELGYAIARRLGIPRVHFFSTKSNSEARDLFYTYDAIGRFRDAQAGRAGGQADVADYIEFEALGEAILDAHAPHEVAHLLEGRRAYTHPGMPTRSVVIIDEVDKASRDFPNDLLREIEDLAFRVPELGRRDGGPAAAAPETPGGIPPQRRPIIVITSNEERQLPDAFLRRCVFHEIAFPEAGVLRRIIASGLEKRLLGGGAPLTLPDEERDALIALLQDFRGLRLDKKPGISEMIDAAALVAYPRDQHPPPLDTRLGATTAALAKLKNDRAEFGALIERWVRQGG
ncbi:AAA family ATPase [Ancylobacter amanitiformis]|uniref:MoxR-like ATPase n=1 Tax=Ancylobacter amanitiformis TaxID=217069 RepID=A0ABU0LU02_9HYPH|nr:MoxR family ATPase [Ancylobacter amanitiformis]MDQ0512162.1 MoxR-like ATPase [Ancylobacter amanitiformis]